MKWVVSILLIFILGINSARTQAVPTEIKYQLVFQGIEIKALRESLEEASSLKKPSRLFTFVSNLFANNKKGAVTLTRALLDKKAQEDLPKFLKILHARGYYDALISLDLQEKTQSIQVIYSINLGQRYQIQSEKIELMASTASSAASSVSDNTKSPALPTLPKLDNTKLADADVLINTAQTLRTQITDRNCLLRINVVPALRLIPSRQSANAIYEVTVGPQANFGKLQIIGNDKVHTRFIRNLMPWRQGDCFQANKVEEAQMKLLESGLFATSEITYPEIPDDNGQAPITVIVKERFHRTLKAGISYMTDEGVGASAAWEHRNFFGDGEKLEVLGVASKLKYSLAANYTEPYLFRHDQSLKIGAEVAHDSTEAYISNNTSLTTIIERKFQGNLRNLRVGAGLGYRLARVQDFIIAPQVYSLVSLPLYADFDNRDDILNPQKGIHFRLDGVPYFDTRGRNQSFYKVLLSGSTYFKFFENNSTVLAIRAALGSIVGNTTDNIPADVRFYAGGGSSVRGYGYQELSPQLNGKSIGGQSLLEGSVELRFKVTNVFGGAAFIDGGGAFQSRYPDFKEKVRFGAGFGLRYYSGLGPLRVDIGFPLNKRPQDSAYQLYVSLGQAF